MRKPVGCVGRGPVGSRFGLLGPVGLLAFLVIGWVTGGVLAVEVLPPGFRPQPPAVHALVNGRVVVRPGQVLESATILIRDGRIEGVGPELSLPPDARVWDMRGLTVYAGFIEAYWPLAQTNPFAARAESATRSAEDFTTGLVNFYGTPGSSPDLGLPGPGYEINKITPEFRAIQHYSPDRKAIQRLRELGFAAALVVPTRGVVRGSSALVALVEGDPNRITLRTDVFQHVALGAPDESDRSYPTTPMGTVAAVRQCFLDARHYMETSTARGEPAAASLRTEYQPALVALEPVVARRQRVLFEPGSVLLADRAARIAREFELDFALLASGEEWRRPDLMAATDTPFIVPLNFPRLPRLPEEADWAQVSLDQLRRWDWAPENPALLRRQQCLVALTTHGLSQLQDFRHLLQVARARGLSEEDALAALTTTPARLCGIEDRLGSIDPGKLAYLTVVEGGSYFDAAARVREVWIDGRLYPVLSAQAETVGSPGGGRSATNQPGEKLSPELQVLQTPRVARSPLEGRGPISAPPLLRLRGVTVWTCAAAGVLTNAELIIRDGKIDRVNPAGTAAHVVAETLDLPDAHVTPGLVDAHSHAMIVGGVNEAALPSSAMCRIGDVINSETVNLRLQLAGGVTTVQLLHGSANPIGGQSQVIKLRDGAGPEGLKLVGAPLGIKFALGENVKQSYLPPGQSSRYPQTRMGVPVFIANRLAAARQYQRAWEAHREPGGRPPRRNLELEALAEVLSGRRQIHCHAYRLDEMLAVLRVFEDFGIRLATFEHGFDGYKIADEIALHGTGVSTSADWWAYKVEAFDAIPFAAGLMHQRGVRVSISSDSPDVARRLNTEAAKICKHSGLSEAEALRLVTLYPAQQLGIADRVGSLEPGKDADLVVWSGPPLDARSVVLQVWIEGRKYFDRDHEAVRVAALARERDELVARARKASASGRAAERGELADAPEPGRFFQRALEHEHDGRLRGCIHEAGCE